MVLDRARDVVTFRGERSVWGSRSAVRSALYMAALAATPYNPTIKAFYQHLSAASKASKAALTACMRKLLTLLNTLSKNRTAWNPLFPNSP